MEMEMREQNYNSDKQVPRECRPRCHGDVNMFLLVGGGGGWVNFHGYSNIQSGWSELFCP